MNVYRMVLQFVDSPADSELRGVFDALESANLASNKRVAEWAKLGYEWQDEIDEDSGYLEDILGAALVIVQRYMTRVVSWMTKLHSNVVADTGGPWTLPTSKRHFLENYGPMVTGCSIRFAAAASSGANFFKHESEWKGDWSGLTGQQGKAFADVEKLGVKQGSTGNVRAIVEGLGVSDFSNFQPFLDGVDGWRTGVLGAVRAELQGKGLL